MSDYTFVEDLSKFQPIPEDGILTRQIFDDSSMRVILFTFSAGQRLSEHTASTTAMLHFLAGEATLKLGSETRAAAAGTWVRMAPGLPHSITTQSPATMLLILLKNKSD